MTGYSSQDAVSMANRMTDLAEHELELIRIATERRRAPGLAPDSRDEVDQILASSSVCYEVYRNWRHFGRHTVGIHPDLYDELSLAGSSRVPGEVLWALPYRNPMVVYPHAPLVDLGDYGRRRLLGFYLSGLSRTEPIALGGDPALLAGVIADTHDRSTVALRLTLYTEVLDEQGRAVDYETFYYSVPRSGADTFAELCEQISQRLLRYGGARPNLGDGAALTQADLLAKMLEPVLATVFYLCSTTVDAQPVSKTIVRRRTPKKRKPVDLVHVGWRIGPELSRLRRASVATSPRDAGGPARQQRPHQRRCHFALRWTGPGRTVPRTVFIAPFWVHPELLGLDASTTLNPAKPPRRKAP